MGSKIMKSKWERRYLGNLQLLLVILLYTLLHSPILKGRALRCNQG